MLILGTAEYDAFVRAVTYGPDWIWWMRKSSQGYPMHYRGHEVIWRHGATIEVFRSWKAPEMPLR